ncbi:MAG: hypothetical protein ACRDFA_06985 [bacterium]
MRAEQATRPATRTEMLQIVNPPAGAIYRIDPTLRTEFQTLSLRATAGVGSIRWSIDGRPVGIAEADTSLMWPLVPGTHRVTARDARGRFADSMIVVK